MEVITNNYQKDIFPLIHQCDHCGSTLKIDSEDVKYGYLGCGYVVCGACGNKTYLGNEGISVDIDENNINFPDHYYHFSVNTGAIELSNGEIRSYIKDGVKYFQLNPDSFCYVTGSGDTKIFMLNYREDEELSITVCKDFYECEIPFSNWIGI